MKLKSLFTLVAVLGSGLTSQLAFAQGVVYVSNTNAPDISSSPFMSGLSLRFTTGSNASGYILDSYALLLEANASESGLATTAVLYYFSGGIVNNLQGNAANNKVSAAGGYDVFTPDSNGSDTSLLAANTEYEIIFNLSSEQLINAGYTPTAPTSVNGWSYDGLVPNSGHPVFAITATPVTAVPEPNTLALVGLGLTACWRYRRK